MATELLAIGNANERKNSHHHFDDVYIAWDWKAKQLAAQNLGNTDQHDAEYDQSRNYIYKFFKL
jgi:hypothetical protein